MEKFLARAILLCGKCFIALALVVVGVPVALVLGFWWLVFSIGDHVAMLWDWAEAHE